MAYVPGQALVGENTPQTHPNDFTDAEIRAEIGHLLKLNQRYGTHLLRVMAYLKLEEFLRDRAAGKIEPAHIDMGHMPGYLYDCPACERRCHCAPGQAQCVYSGDHHEGDS